MIKYNTNTHQSKRNQHRYHMKHRMCKLDIDQLSRIAIFEPLGTQGAQVMPKPLDR